MSAFIESHVPPDYQSPSFPALYWPPQNHIPEGSLYYVYDIWRFTLIWTLIIYAIFHVGAAAVALVIQLGRGPSRSWRYLWTIPISYLVTAAVEAVVAGSLVGLLVGAVYTGGSFWMSTWIPFVWGWANVIVLIISSFSIQGGL